MASPNSPDLPNLDGYVLVVGYELAELTCDAIWVAEPPTGTGADTTLANALLEAMLVHARCLLEFLINQAEADRVTAGDFVASWKPPNKSALGKEYGRICNALSHLSKKRLTVKEGWVPAEIVRLILEPFEDLVGHLGGAPHEVILGEYVAGVRSLYEARLVKPATTSFSTTDTVIITGSTGPPPEK